MTISLDGIEKSFGPVPAVIDFTLTLEDHEFFVLLGPSGCGKTTVLRLIAGLETPDAGKIEMDGEDWTEIAPQKRDVAMVFQQYSLYPQRTVRGNIEYPLRIKGTKPDEIHRKVKWIASLLGIEPILDRKPKQLSGGEAQRVGLARALVREPACFLLDEPLSNLDAQLRVRSRAEIKRIQRELEVTTLYVTHDQEEAVALADRIAIMNKGRLVQIGTAEEIYQLPATTFVASFIGKPSMNLVRSTILAHELKFSIIELGPSNGENPQIELRLGRYFDIGSQIFIGFRPEHLSISKNDRSASLKSSWTVPALVEYVEGLDPNYVIQCDTPAGTLFVSTRKVPSSRMVWITLPKKKAHYFNANTGKRFDIKR